MMLLHPQVDLHPHMLLLVPPQVDPEVQAPQLLDQLFSLGTDLLLANLDVIWAGMASLLAQPQNGAAATPAPKLLREEAALDFAQPALAVHNKVRGFAGWPGTHHVFSLSSPEGGAEEQVELKVLRTRVPPAGQAPWANGSSSSGSSSSGSSSGGSSNFSSSSGGGSSSGSSSGGVDRVVAASRRGLFVRCGDGSALELLEVQAPGKRAMAAADFVNGLKGRVLRWQPLPAPAVVAAA